MNILGEVRWKKLKLNFGDALVEYGSLSSEEIKMIFELDLFAAFKKQEQHGRKYFAAFEEMNIGWIFLQLRRDGSNICLEYFRNSEDLKEIFE